MIDRRRMWRTVSAVLLLAVLLTALEVVVKPADRGVTLATGVFPLVGAPVAWFYGPRLSPSISYQVGRIFLALGTITSGMSMYTWRDTELGGAMALYMVVVMGFAAVFYTNREVLQLVAIEAVVAFVALAADGFRPQDLLILVLLVISVGATGLVMSSSIRAAELLSFGDPLTGAANRRAWDLVLAEALRSHRRSQHSLSVMLIDVDNFKDINDRFGHDGGDGVLRDGIGAMIDALRPRDVLARFGGDEFAVVMEQADHEDAMAVAHRLQAKFHGSTGATCSIGVATVPAGSSADAIMMAADAELYAAKEAGRDRIRGVSLGLDGIVGPEVPTHRADVG